MTPRDTQQPDHAGQIRAADESWRRAAAARDLDGMMAIYAPDARELLPNMPPIVGRDSIRAFYAELLQRFPRFAHALHPDDIIVAASGDLAVVRGTFRFTADTLRPQEVQTGKYVGVWHHNGERWQLQLNISNAAPAEDSR